MRYFLPLALLLFVGWIGWLVGKHMSADALGVVVGMLFGMLGAVVMLLPMVVGFQRQQHHRDQPPTYHQQPRIEVHHHQHFYAQPRGADSSTGYAPKQISSTNYIESTG